MRKATVRDYMATQLVVLRPDMDIHRAIGLLLDHHLSGAPVLDALDRLVGVLSKKDCLEIAFQAGYHQDRAGTVGAYMSTDVETIDPDVDIVRAAELFLQTPYRRFPVIRDGRLVGVISRHDVLRALHELA
jgi:CBS domain-containing protein